MKNLNDLDEEIYQSKIGQKILKIRGMYHPNLVANLSKEAYDIYTVRMSICDQLLEQLDKKGIKFKKIEDFIRDKAKNIKKGLKFAKNGIEADLIKLAIKEWEEFL
jgi:hypothetical protein